jgi:hypothetical protein
MTNQFCHECGAELKSNSQKFCGMCGAPTLLNSQTPSLGKQELSIFSPLDRAFNRQEFPEFSEGVFSFRHANLTLVQATSRSWFPGEYKSSSELISQVNSEIRPEWVNDFEVNDMFLDGEDFFSEYEAIAWESSALGDRFLKSLTARGVSYSQGTIGVIVEFDKPDGTIERLPLSTQIDLVSGQWGLSDGTRYLQKGEVFRSKVTGQDIIFWNIDALATTRPRAIESNAAFSNHLLIPHQLQVATYLAETSFPSAIAGSMGMAKRETSFGDNVAQVVRPVTRHISDGRIIGLDHSDLGYRSLALWAPDVWQHGYVFDDTMTDEEIYNQLSTVSDGLAKIAEILVDGYCNWPSGSELDFQIALWSDYALCNENDYYRNGAIVPGVLYWELFQRSNARYDEAYNALHQEVDEALQVQGLDALQVLLYEGVGSIFLHAGNTWAASAMAVYEDFDCSEELEFLSTIDVDSQGINALSNLIVWHIQNGSFEDAEPLVDIAIRGTDRMGPKLETHSHFHPNDGSVEVSIFIEVFESALTVKSELNRAVELKQIAQKALKFCEKYSADSELLRTAQRLAK